MPDCAICPITEALRMERDNAQSAVNALQVAVEWSPDTSRLTLVAVKLARARHQVDTCDNLLALVQRAGEACVWGRERRTGWGDRDPC